MKYLKLLIAGVCSLVAFVAIMLVVTPLHANPSSFFENPSAATTTTVSYLAAGVGTTTNSFDTQNGGILAPADTASLLIQFAGSSTASILNTAFEYSQDNVSWFQDTLTASTTQVDAQAIASLHSFSWTFASTTVGGGNVTNANSATTSRAIVVKSPTRYIRAIFTMPAGSAGGAVWSDFVSKRENR